jgi:MarR family 2-MHQ and catechol resistance regulon transcriptional repressor
MVQELTRLHSAGTRSPAILSWLRLARVFQKVDRLTSDALREDNLSAAQFDVLAHVGAAAGPTQQELADSLLVTKGNICQLLDRMEKSGLLARRHEGRSNRLYLTERGRQVFADTVPEHEATIEQAFATLSVDEQRTLLGLLRKLDRALD